MRLVGRRGPSLVERVVRARFGDNVGSEEVTMAISDYLYHITAATGSGEYAMNSLLQPIISRNERGVFARDPIGRRLKHAPFPMWFGFGSMDWMWNEKIRSLVHEITNTGGICQLEFIDGAGHHVYLDNHLDFEAAVARFMSNHVYEQRI